MRDSLISIVALASLASFMFLSAASPAAARPKTCQQKATACESRCAGRFDSNNYVNCVYRTCAKQYGTCGRG
jgi:hypothetical protein